MLSPRNSFPCLHLFLLWTIWALRFTCCHSFLPSLFLLLVPFHLLYSFPLYFSFIYPSLFPFPFYLSFFWQSHFLWILFTILYCYRSRISNGIQNNICVVFVVRFKEFVCTFDPERERERESVVNILNGPSFDSASSEVDDKKEAFYICNSNEAYDINGTIKSCRFLLNSFSIENASRRIFSKILFIQEFYSSNILI